ncbi:MAG: hypothetical protein PVJ27_11150, partial [Candidatus Brocadiaceae bacterium]
LDCPGCRSGGGGGCSYAYFPRRSEGSDDPYAVIVSDSSAANHQGEGGWVLRRNGGLDWVTAEQLETLRPASDRAEPSPVSIGTSTR